SPAQHSQFDRMERGTRAFVHPGDRGTRSEREGVDWRTGRRSWTPARLLQVRCAGGPLDPRTVREGLTTRRVPIRPGLETSERRCETASLPNWNGDTATVVRGGIESCALPK